MIDRVRLGKVARAVLGWVGVAGLVTCGAVLDVGAAFPGYLALWPVLSAVAIIVAGRAGGADRLLSTRAAQYLGTISFPLYLWHWPVLVVFLVLAGLPSAGPVGGLVVVAVSVALAIATHHLLEEPLRGVSLARLGRVRAPALVAACLVPALVALGVWSAIAAAGAGAPVALGDPSHPGAAALAADHVVDGDPAAPVRAVAGAAAGRLGGLPGRVRPGGRPPRARGVRAGPRRGRAAAPGHPRRRLPHAADSSRPSSRWRGSSTGRCARSSARAARSRRPRRPTRATPRASSGTRPRSSTSPPRRRTRWSSARHATSGRGSPSRPPRASWPPGSASTPPASPSSRCATTRASTTAPRSASRRWAAVPPTARSPAASSWPRTRPTRSSTACRTTSGSSTSATRSARPTTCPPEIGNVLVYLDDNHLTASYSRTLSTAVSQRLPGLLGW